MKFRNAAMPQKGSANDHCVIMVQVSDKILIEDGRK